MRAGIPSGLRATFPVGQAEVHSVRVEFSSWSGLETYHVDGGEVLRVRNTGDATEHEFELGEREKHRVMVRARIVEDELKASAYVDGILYRPDLFAKTGSGNRMLVGTIWLGGAAAFLAAVGALLALL